jgi:tRNA(fMet)-specific endonuclease VapC
MVIMLDADVVISGEKSTFDLQRWLASLAEEQFEVAAITVAELWHGVERASAAHKASRQAYLQALLAVLPVVSYTEQTAYLHARIWARQAASGKSIGAHDLIVAATALERGSTLATFNKRQFSGIKGLTIIEPKLK